MTDKKEVTEHKNASLAECNSRLFAGMRKQQEAVTDTDEPSTDAEDSTDVKKTAKPKAVASKKAAK